MKVIFKHNHVLGKIGSILTLPKPKAFYLLRCKVVELYKEKPKVKPKAKTTKTSDKKKETE